MPSFPGFEQIYLLEDPLSKRPLRGEIETKVDSFALMRGELTTTESVRISWAMGGQVPSDLIWTTSALPIIVHRRVVGVLRENNFTGWSTYATSVTDKKGRSYPDYEGLVILGRCGGVDLSRSVVVLSEYPAGWFPHFLGRYFPEQSWDGSDIFMERPDSSGHVSAHVFVTEKVREAFDKAKISNVLFERLTEVDVMTSVYENGCSHLLPPDFSHRVDAAYRRAGVRRPP
jgi:hypothetical protein